MPYILVEKDNSLLHKTEKSEEVYYIKFKKSVRYLSAVLSILGLHYPT